MNKKKIIVLAIITLLIVVVIVFAVKKSNSEKDIQTEEFVSQSPDGVRTNISTKLHEPKTFEGIEISDIKLSEHDGITDLSATVKNVSDSKQGGYAVELKIQDKDSNELITIPVYISELEPNANTEFTTSTRLDFANAYDFIIEKSEETPVIENE